MAWDPIILMDLLFTLVIAIMGIWAYRKKANVVALYVAIGFILFAISHLALLLGAASSEISLLVIVTLGYLVIIFAMFKAAR